MAEEFWKTSPFGEDSIFAPGWEEKQKQERLQQLKKAEIIGINIEKGSHEDKKLLINVEKDNLDPMNYRIPSSQIRLPINLYPPIEQAKLATVPVIVLVTIKGLVDNINITVNGDKRRAEKRINGYLAVFDLKIPLKAGKKEFEITAQITDFIGGTVLDSKKILVTIDLNGNELEREELEVRKDIKSLEPSLNLYAFIKELEGVKNVTYNDEGEIIKFMPYSSVEGGAQTIAWGHKIKKGEDFSSGITKEQAEELLIKDVQTEGVDKLLKFKGDKKIIVPLYQHEYDAIISAVFNNGYGETLVAAINKGADYYAKQPETIYKAFLTRRFVGKSENDGLIKRRAREADIFVKNQWHSYGPTDSKFKSGKSYIEAFKKFITTGVLPLILFMVFIQCSRNDSNIKLNSDVNNASSVIDQTPDTISDPLELALSRIPNFNSGEGSNSDATERYKLEQSAWKNEISLIYEKLRKKIELENISDLKNIEEYHKGWEKYMDTKRGFTAVYIEHFIKSGESIYYLFPFFIEEYKSKLTEYYNLYDID